MARLKKSDLGHLSTEQIRGFYLNKGKEHPQKFPSPIEEFLNLDNDRYFYSLRVRRVSLLLGMIIVERFITGTL